MNADLHREEFQEFNGRFEYDVFREECEESVVDDRAGLRPADVVQRNLLRAMPLAAVPVSCLHTRRDTRR